ncbi:hypothetical protein BCR36DRAFT_364616 [Piromyces finnis]|uniref:MATH domain-containing protein n=1 Tax=Piromyces finnis TaxID=1754191 RepID=A0A1Y1USD6_9FUNG|nr:hypothetical protein BCR36DRAFT_364616 [Piromyces finnis]|eukprot:ORX40434.1 hypothetical protein BCR36DRAFT_364616 [Piromyces finnis]
MLITEDQYINRLKNSLHDDADNKNVLDEGFFEWEINNWSSLKVFEVSPTFNIGNYTWKIALIPNGYNDGNGEYVSLYLGNHDVELKDNLNVYGSFVFAMRNSNDYSHHHIEKTNGIECFNKNNDEHHFPKFIKKRDLFSKNKKTNKLLIENNKVVISVYLRVYRKGK